MDTNQAAEHIQVIRTLMERSALYRRALAPIMTFVGALGITAGLVGWLLNIESVRGFVLYWFGIAAVAITGSLLLSRRQALKHREPFWSPPTRRIAQSVLPGFSLGILLGIEMLYINQGGIHLAIALWTCLYGLALHSAGFAISRGIRILGWLYCVFGCVLLIWYTGWFLAVPADLLMGSIFGCLQLAAGIYLYFTEKSGNES